jgi:hypothetical protein
MNAKLKLTPEQREYFRAQGRRGGMLGGGKASPEAKAAAGRKGAEARHSRTRAMRQSLTELLAVAREVGGFLDSLPRLTGDAEQQRKELSDRLYTIVTTIAKQERK